MILLHTINFSGCRVNTPGSEVAVVVQSVMSNCWWPLGAALQASLSFTISQSLLKFMLSNHLIICHPILLLPSIFPSIRVFPMSRLFVSGDQSIGASPSVSALPLNIQRWFPLGLTDLISLWCKGLSSLLQHYNLKESTLWHSAFFMVQLSHPYVTIGTTVALTRRTFVSIMMSLLLNTLSRLVTAFLPRSKCLELFNFKNPHYFSPLPHTFWSF